MKKLLIATTFLALTATSAAAFWDVDRNSDAATAEQMDRLLEEANKQIGLPNIVNFFEKRMVKMLYELRDDPEYATITYITTLDGKFVKVCDSVGFGINASIQYSNPVRPVDISVTPTYDYGGFELDLMPQAEPNGLFMPEGLAATFVMCVNPATKEMQPVYLEQEITVSPFPLN